MHKYRKNIKFRRAFYKKKEMTKLNINKKNMKKKQRQQPETINLKKKKPLTLTHEHKHETRNKQFQQNIVRPMAFLFKASNRLIEHSIELACDGNAFCMVIEPFI